MEKMDKTAYLLQIPDNKGTYHPHMVGMAPLEGDETVMGKCSASHTIMSMG